MNKNTQLRLAFIGGAVDSIIGQSHHAAAVLDGQWQLCAGSFSRQSQRNQETGLRWAVPADALYEDAHALINERGGELDAIAILTPSPSHHEYLQAAIKAGIPVISEKPLTTTLEDALDIQRLQKEHDGFVAVTYNYNAYPMVRELRNRVHAGALGQLWQVQMEMPQAGMSAPRNGDVPDSLAWRLNDDGPVPAVLGDLGSHAVDMARFCTGEWPEAVFAEITSHNPVKTGMPDAVRLLLRYKSGLSGSIWATTTATGNRHGMSIRLHGSEGGAAWYQEAPEQLYWNPLDDEHRVIDRASPQLTQPEAEVHRMKPGHPTGFLDGFANLYTDVARCLRNDRRYSSYTSTVNQSVAGMQLMYAALESARSGGWQSIVYTDGTT